jgi:hypothetical protein
MLLRLTRQLGAVLAGLGMLAVPGSPAASADDALPADQVVFMVDSGGGLVPPVVYALESPSLVIYGDGRILSIVKDDAGGAVPARYQLTRVDPLAVAAFVSSTEASGIINPDKDFGRPPVTDMDATTVMVHGENGPATVSVYAFHDQFDKDLTADQQKARAAARQLIDTASNLTAGAPAVPYTPDRVVVYDVGLGYGDRTATTVWPGPPPASFLTPSNQSRSVACGQLSGVPAATVYDAARENPGALWLVDGAARVLAVNPLPITESCP